MAGLVSCIECGESLSSDAKSCPHCNTLYPHGLKCFLCGKFGKESQRQLVNSYINYWVDSQCFEKIVNEVKSLEFTCPVCKHTQTYRGDPNQWKRGGVYIPGEDIPKDHIFLDACPKCSHPRDYTLDTVACKVCHLPTIQGPYSSSGAQHRICAKSQSYSGSCLFSVLSIIVALCSVAFTLYSLAMI